MMDGELRLGCVQVAERLATRGQYDAEGVVQIAQQLYAFVVNAQQPVEPEPAKRGPGRPRKDTPSVLD